MRAGTAGAVGRPSGDTSLPARPGATPSPLERAAAHHGLSEAADRIVAAASDMAERFRRGATLYSFGEGMAASDAQHVAVEFVHPVIVGKPALPAVSLSVDVASRLSQMAHPDDIALGVSPTGLAPLARALEAACGHGLLTVALVGAVHDDDAGDHRAVRHLIGAAADDPLLSKELHVTTYHLLWELVHVFLEQDPYR